jgi:glucan-binding YG repeat protein
MDGCIKGGYGIAVPQEGGTFKFFYFDGNFFTDTATLNGTGGQLLAYNIVTNTVKSDHVEVTVTGTLTNVFKDSTRVEGKEAGLTYQVINLDTITETDTLALPQTTTAAVTTTTVAEKTASSQQETAVETTNRTSTETKSSESSETSSAKTDVPSYTTLEGYIIDEDCFEYYSDSPGSDIKDCLLMSGCASSGYGIAVPQ